MTPARIAALDDLPPCKCGAKMKVMMYSIHAETTYRYCLECSDPFWVLNKDSHNPSEPVFENAFGLSEQSVVDEWRRMQEQTDE